jgi:hypothetical protein
VENYGSFLARHPATEPLVLVEGSSWSCSHGIERWRSDCGCRTKSGTSQAWRKPLRQALDALATELHGRFADEAAGYFPDPWEARDAYAAVGPPSSLPVRARELLEMERNTLRMFTSCGWFFDDLAGLETIVCLRYAARAIELAGADAPLLESGFLDRLDEARSNDPRRGSGREIYQEAVRARRPGHLRAAASYAALLAVDPDALRPGVGAYLVGARTPGLLAVTHRRTGAEWEVRTTVDRPAPARLGVTAETATERGIFSLDELSEYEQEQIRLALRRALRVGVLSEEEDRRIAEGCLRFERAVAWSLVRQLPVHPREAHGLDLDRLSRTLDLLTLERQPIPFDAQTRFHRIMLEGPRETRRLLSRFTDRFGFIAGLGQADAPLRPAALSIRQGSEG